MTDNLYQEGGHRRQMGDLSVYLFTSKFWLKGVIDYMYKCILGNH